MSKRGRPRLSDSEKTKRPNDKLPCEICQGIYTRANKSAHIKTKQHQQALKYETILKDTLNQQIPKHKTMMDRVADTYYDLNGEKIHMLTKKFNYYNKVSIAKNGYPMYFNSLNERNKILPKYK